MEARALGCDRIVTEIRNAYFCDYGDLPRDMRVRCSDSQAMIVGLNGRCFLVIPSEGVHCALRYSGLRPDDRFFRLHIFPPRLRGRWQRLTLTEGESNAAALTDFRS